MASVRSKKQAKRLAAKIGLRRRVAGERTVLNWRKALPLYLQLREARRSADKVKQDLYAENNRGRRSNVAVVHMDSRKRSSSPWRR